MADRAAPLRVALFGGSFNPPHVGHLLAALYVLETAPVDELWLLPAWQHPFDKQLVAFAHRRAMCEQLAAALGPRVRVNDIEARLGGESRTLRTVKALAAQFPQSRFSWIIGSDLRTEVSTWYGAEELQRLVTFVVVGRGQGGGASDAVAPHAEPEVRMPAVSSTEIRRRLAAGQSVQSLLPRAVLDYVQRTKLYGTPES